MHWMLLVGMRSVLFTLSVGMGALMTAAIFKTQILMGLFFCFICVFTYRLSIDESLWVKY